MIKGLTKLQETALAEMKPFEWYSPYELESSRETLEELYNNGLLCKHGNDDDPHILYRIEKERI